MADLDRRLAALGATRLADPPPLSALRQRAGRIRRRRQAVRATGVVAALLVVALVVIQSGPSVELAPVAPSADPFVGTWEAVDLDGSFLRMTIHARDDGTFEVEVIDDSSAACWGAPATMSGNGTLVNDTRMTITQVYRCEDGTVVTEAGGIRLDEWYLDLAGGVLTDPTGVVWYRPGTEPPAWEGPAGLDSVSVDTSLGTWTWTWIPEDEGASRRWQKAFERWEDEDRFPASIEDMSWATDEWWEDNWEWVHWNRVPWARAGAVTIATFLGGSPTNPADTREDWYLVVDAGDEYQLHDVPWHGLPVMDVDLALRADLLVAAALVGDLATNDWNPSDEPPLLHAWGSTDGVQWEELGRPLAVGDARRLRLVGDNDRLLLRLEGPVPSMWTSPDGVDWQQVGPDRIRAWHWGTPAPTSYGWAVASSFHADAHGDVWHCEVWVSADTVHWEQVPFQQVVERRPLGDALNCRVFDDDVYVLLTEQQGTSDAYGLWIGQLDRRA